MGKHTSEMESISKVAVLGTGTMGIDIALLFALKGFSVVLWHRRDSKIAYERLSGRLEKYVSKEILTQCERDIAYKHISCVNRLEELVSVGLVVESIAEDVKEKSGLLCQVSEIISKTCVLASNTSSLSIEEISACIAGASRFAGLHFFNPVLRMELVEIITGTRTSSATIAALHKISKKIGKIAIEVKDSAGFVVNRLMACQIREAMLLLEEGIASPEDIDNAVKLGLAHPIGPLALADLIGLDVMLSIFNALSKKMGARFEAPLCLKTKVADGMLGRKTRKGFFEY